ncbi:hypothetical protein IJ103_00210 [Candidatus Saccharibacteria bacterium]|nr:hypothetical protein [Candidatus Saccharibacteria bacterium]MBQ9016656.1 hypothetical protein [Candidatus Saccharibacteria bacterium]
MNIYIAGISGTGMGPLALMAKRAGFKVFGSDKAEGAVAPELYKEEIPIEIGEQDGKFLTKCFEAEGVDWFIHTSAMGPEAPEVLTAKKLGLKISKRDELIAYLVNKLGLKMVAVAGTHGKTTTTAMITWAALELGLPVSYLVGSTLPFAEAGSYQEDSEFLIYEADEYDRNFLKFYPWLAVVTTISYDHPDIYPTKEDYEAAFMRFMSQSERVIREPSVSATAFALAGEKRRYDAALALEAVKAMAEEVGREVAETEIIELLNQFPGVGRRFERIAPGVYSDYGHHPEEIAATVEMAVEEAERLGLRGVVAIYEPHQNTRQHEVKNGYRKSFEGASRIFWLPTYLTREDPTLPVLKPVEFIARLSNASLAEPAEMDAKLLEKLRQYLADGYLLLFMSAGPLDGWVRQNLS